MHALSPAAARRLVRQARTNLGSRIGVADLLRVPLATVDTWLAG